MGRGLEVRCKSENLPVVGCTLIRDAHARFCVDKFFRTDFLLRSRAAAKNG